VVRLFFVYLFYNKNRKTMNFITDKQHKALKKGLTSALSNNKKAVAAIEANDLDACLKVDGMIKWKCEPSVKPFIYDIAKALCETKIDGKGNKSTAMFAAYDGLWTIGNRGSVFIDIKVSGTAFRVHYVVFEDERIFYVES